jgi:type II secretion system protein I
MRRKSLANTKAADNAGFTLLEVIIALAIMVIAFAAILSVESSSINASARAHQMNIVAMLAKDQMVETESGFLGKTFDEVKKEDHGAFPEPYQDYSWNTSVKEIEFPALNINALGGGGSGDQSGNSSNGGDQGQNEEMVETVSKLITQYLSQAVREVTVTINLKKGGGEQHFSVTTYWVDLNHEFQLSQ